MDISDWRNKIDGLDEQIVQLLSQRAAAAVEIGKLKAKINVPIYEPQREQTVFEHVRRVNPGPLTDAQVQDVYERVMDVMRALQRQQPYARFRDARCEMRDARWDEMEMRS